MELHGVVRNGVVVFDGDASLPEGAEVSVTLCSGPKIRVAKNRKLVAFPLVESSDPGNVYLTNAMIGEILDQEDTS